MTDFWDSDIEKLNLTDVEKDGLQVYRNYTTAFEKSAAARFVSESNSIKYDTSKLEYIVKKEGLVFVDDYAHHPEELRALISGAKSLFPKLKCTVIFQPHLFTRTRDFVDGFAESLDLADEIILLPIYPARELPIEGVTSKLIFDKMKNGNKHLMSKEQVIERMKEKNEGLIITAGAGDIDALILPIKNILTKTN